MRVTAGPRQPVHLTDLGNAQRLVTAHGASLRYCHAWRRWLIYDGGRWRKDESEEILRLAKETALSIYTEAANPKLDQEQRKRIADHAKASESESKIRAMVRLARSEVGLPISPAKLDASPHLLACTNGTLDLRTGNLRASDPDDLLIQGTEIAFDAEAQCPRWLRFLDEVFDGDADLIDFVHRLVGYSLTGETREHVVAVLHGAGGNGKSVLVETIKRLLGEGLAATAAFESFTQARADRGPRNDLARLHGARMVVASESRRGRRLDEATVKQLTGGDTITARYLYGEHFEYRPQFKLWLVTNHRPRVDGGDEAIWRRLRLIPFRVSFAGREDRTLGADLTTELPGILAWAVRGCLRWQRHGLGSASAVEAATSDYRKDEDVFGSFLADRCEMAGDVEAKILRSEYEAFCREIGEEPLSANLLGKELAQRGIARCGAGGRRYRGVSIRE